MTQIAAGVVHETHMTAPVRRTILRVCGVMIAAGAIWFLAQAGRDLTRVWRQAASRSRFQAVVISIDDEHLNLSGKFSWYQYRVGVRYDGPGGRPVEDVAGAVTNSKLRVGERIAVLVDPAGREATEVDTSLRSYFEDGMVVLISGVLLYGALFLLARVGRIVH